MEDGDSGEDRFIARFLRPLAAHPAALGLRDDAALIAPPAGTDLVVTKDALVAGVHFFADDPPGAIAQKALRVNLSDLAAKGAVPFGAFLALALPREADEAWLEAFFDGLGADVAAYGCPILGGDTVRTPGPLTLSVTALGTVPRGEFVPRTGARPGQAIIVSGTIGDAALGLKLRQEPGRFGFLSLIETQRGHLSDRYLHPQPRLALAPLLRSYAAAAMDVSDGLVGDVAKLLVASGCGGWITSSDVPLSAAAAAAVAAEPDLLRTALTGGDDYEIAAVLPVAALPAFAEEALALGIPVCVIGETCVGRGLDVLDAAGDPLQFGVGSYSHF
ncbi:thiamine-phosphate kinase [Aquabacter spiritensis]|uniref:Thiamine-monophosphate kinase n=1 Tax=Aquabacter spiritensis TaxID=933073 RepID=A0A4R3LSY3_9HYPH|nr:thiamine-phosphate kinase [Aquabacter spiritensis]TCT03481.1 thiamine-phosphate kinase [Aquabacter spiritensis]